METAKQEEEKMVQELTKLRSKKKDTPLDSLKTELTKQNDSWQIEYSSHDGDLFPFILFLY